MCWLVDRWSGKRIGGGPPFVYVSLYGERERERERRRRKKEKKGMVGLLVFDSILVFFLHFSSLTR